MRHLFLIMGVLCCPFWMQAQTNQETNHKKIPWGIDMRYHASHVLIQLSQEENAGTFQSSNFLSPGIGLYLKPVDRKHVSVLAGTYYENRGSGESIFIRPTGSPTTIFSANRFRSLVSEVQVRGVLTYKQFQPFVGVGSTLTTVLKRSYTNGQDLAYWEQVFGSNVIRPTNYRTLTWGYVFSAGVTYNQMVSFELTHQTDIRPVLNRSDAVLRLETTSFVVRYNLNAVFSKKKKTS
ncbi:MAG: hypothetical protein ACRCYO_19090 [Bacteroidia bacterium]